jgi:hypothetical protein
MLRSATTKVTLAAQGCLTGAVPLPTGDVDGGANQIAVRAAPQPKGLESVPRSLLRRQERRGGGKGDAKK